jgi:hypothetical protein
LEVGGKRVYIEPPEECIVSALAACVYWGSDLDCEKAAMVMVAQWDAIVGSTWKGGAPKRGLPGSWRRSSGWSRAWGELLR